MIGVYAIVHVPTGKAYIGSSLDIHKRFSTHKSMLKNNYQKRKLVP
jgi:predicted GIY-YIG superfamily endonuclease